MRDTAVPRRTDRRWLLAIAAAPLLFGACSADNDARLAAEITPGDAQGQAPGNPSGNPSGGAGSGNARPGSGASSSTYPGMTTTTVVGKPGEATSTIPGQAPFPGAPGAAGGEPGSGVNPGAPGSPGSPSTPAAPGSPGSPAGGVTPGAQTPAAPDQAYTCTNTNTFFVAWTAARTDASKLADAKAASARMAEKPPTVVAADAKAVNAWMQGTRSATPGADDPVRATTIRLMGWWANTCRK